LFFTVFYALQCGGTSPQMRNIEMRYFLHADVLLLFPAAWLMARFNKRTTAPLP
jgi:hypothetical protein